MRAKTLLLLGLCALGCAGDEQAAQNTPDENVDASIDVPWPIAPFPELAPRREPIAVLEARAELGRLLFYDPILSVDRETACASCHSEIWGMGDGLARSIGHGGGLLSGPGRKGGPVLRRNAPQLWNLAFRKTLFWDGRSNSLKEQALEPLRSVDEMNRAPEEAVAELASLDSYVTLFEQAFPGEPGPSVDQLAQALAEFQRSLISSRSLYDGYLAGDAYALTQTQIDGMFRFAELGCADCHVPPLFESEAFFDRKLAPTEGVTDEGRKEVTKAARDLRAFRVPSLRNVAFSEPYFHDGSARTLEEAVGHELGLSGQSFDERDVELITRFISDALKDETREPDRPDSVPSGLPVPLDGTFIDRF